MEYFNYTITDDNDKFSVTFPDTHPLLPAITVNFYKDRLDGDIFKVKDEVKRLMERAEEKRKSELYFRLADELLRLKLK